MKLEITESQLEKVKDLLRNYYGPSINIISPIILATIETTDAETLLQAAYDLGLITISIESNLSC